MDQTFGCCLGRYLLENLHIYLTLESTKPMPLVHAHPTQVLNTLTQLFSKKSNTHQILIKIATQFWLLLNVINVMSKEKVKP